VHLVTTVRRERAPLPQKTAAAVKVSAHARESQANLAHFPQSVDGVMNAALGRAGARVAPPQNQ
jgi:hypothetical protein